jgi:hypothetical protein
MGMVTVTDAVIANPSPCRTHRRPGGRPEHGTGAPRSGTPAANGATPRRMGLSRPLRLPGTIGPRFAFLGRQRASAAPRDNESADGHFQPRDVVGFTHCLYDVLNQVAVLPAEAAKVRRHQVTHCEAVHARLKVLGLLLPYPRRSLVSVAGRNVSAALVASVRFPGNRTRGRVSARRLVITIARSHQFLREKPRR